MHKTVELSRDVPATMIPAGTPIVIPKGTEVTITQALGGAYTVMGPGVMARIGGQDADALGFAAETSTAKPAKTEQSGPVHVDQVWEQLKNCYDPEIPVNIVDLGLVYDCQLTKTPEGGNRVDVKMTLTAPGCGMGPAIAHDAQSKILTIDGVDEADVQLVWDPPWNQNMISEAGRMKLGMV